MLDEAAQAGDRALIFTQFAEMRAIIQEHLQETFGIEPTAHLAGIQPGTAAGLHALSRLPAHLPSEPPHGTCRRQALLAKLAGERGAPASHNRMRADGRAFD